MARHLRYPSIRFARLAIVAGLVALSTSGAIMLGATSASGSPVGGQSVTICHRTTSDTNPYVMESPDISATGLHGGHITHTGPLWNPTLKAQHIKWGDIIPPFDYKNKQGVTVHYPGLNDTPAGQQILANSCVIPTVVAPGALGITQSVCAGEPSAATVPEVTFPETAGITYSIDVAPAAGGTSTVTATATAPANWFAPPGAGGWTYVDLTHETQQIQFDAAPQCSVPTTVAAADPTIVQSVCVGTLGDISAPTLTLAETEGITYSVDPSGPYTAGQTGVVVTATADTGNQFVAPAPAGWTFVDATHETFAVTFTTPTGCTAGATGAIPVDPTVVNSACTNGQLTAPTLTFATEPAGVTYTASAGAPYTAGQSVTVTATADNTVQFQGAAPTGWTYVDASHATFAVAFAASPTCSGALAQTGTRTQQMLLLGGTAIALGIGFLWASTLQRRRV